MAIARDISYVNRDFDSLRSRLVNFSQTYFPNTYTDFDPSSPGIMFIEQAAYVGDVLSFYVDNQVQETYVQYARQNSNLFDLAYMFGYKPKLTGLATTDIDFFQLVPSKNANSPIETSSADVVNAVPTLFQGLLSLENARVSPM